MLGTNSPLKYLGYIAIVIAVVVDLYAGKPDGDATWRLILDGVALAFAVIGLGGLAASPARLMRR